MKRNIDKQVIKALTEFQRFIITGHEEPDGDSLGSAAALALFLRRQGKQVVLCSAGPFRRPEVLEYKHLFQREWPLKKNTEIKTMTILLDCSGLERTGYPVEFLQEYPILIIDHHANGSTKGDFNYIDASMPSTTLLVQKIIEAMDGPCTQEEAEHIFTGFCTDTGFFKHIGKGQGEVFQLISRLCDTGISPKQTFDKLAVSRTAGTVKLMGRIMSRVDAFFEGQVIVSWETAKDRQECHTDERNSADIYPIMLSIENASLAALIREDPPGISTVGLRSKDRFDAGALAAHFGGGGHKNAAGFQTEASLKDIKEAILDYCQEKMLKS